MSRAILMLLMISMVISSGCAEIDKQGGYANYLKCKFQKECVKEVNFTGLHEIEKPQPVLLDKIAYFIEPEDDIEEGLISFIKASDNYLFCIFPVMESERVANALIGESGLNNDVRLILGREGTMTGCNNVCLPLLGSQYNNMLEGGVNMQIIPAVRQSYCVNDLGMFMSSISFEKETENDNDIALLVYSDKISYEFKGGFERIWQ